MSPGIQAGDASLNGATVLESVLSNVRRITCAKLTRSRVLPLSLVFLSGFDPISSPLAFIAASTLVVLDISQVYKTSNSMQYDHAKYCIAIFHLHVIGCLTDVRISARRVWKPHLDACT